MKKYIILSLLSVFTVFSSCRKEKNNNQITFEPGLGDSKENPTGTSFTLPSDVVFNGDATTINGYYDCSNDSLRILGFGTYVELIVPLRNNRNDTAFVTFPGGLIFVSSSTADQNGLLIQTYVVKIPPLSDWCVSLHLSCTNLGRHIPEIGSVYKNPVVTNSQKLLELVDILSTKQLLRLCNSNASSYSFDLQMAIWNITEYGALTAEDRAFLNTIP